MPPGSARVLPRGTGLPSTSPMNPFLTEIRQTIIPDQGSRHGPLPPLWRGCDYGVAVMGIVEVGVDFPQPYELKSFAQFNQRVPDAKHNVKPFAGGCGKIRPRTAHQRDRQPLAPEPGGRTLDHRVARVGRPHAEAPAREHRRINARAARGVQHSAGATDPLQQARRRGLGLSRLR